MFRLGSFRVYSSRVPAPDLRRKNLSRATRRGKTEKLSANGQTPSERLLALVGVASPEPYSSLAQVQWARLF